MKQQQEMLQKQVRQQQEMLQKQVQQQQEQQQVLARSPALRQMQQWAGAQQQQLRQQQMMQNQQVAPMQRMALVTRQYAPACAPALHTALACKTVMRLQS